MTAAIACVGVDRLRHHGWQRSRLPAPPTSTARPLRPSALQTDVASRVAGVVQLVARARRRVFWQQALRRVVWPLLALATLFACWALGARLGWIAAPHDFGWAAAAAAIAAIGLGAAVAQRLDWMAIAAQIDARAATQDRLSTALELAGAGRRDPWALVQAAEAERVLPTVDLRQLWPTRAPPHLGAVAGALALGVVAAFLPLDGLRDTDHGGTAAGVALALPVGHAGVVVAAELLGADAIELLRADAAMLEDIESQVEDASTKAWIGNVRKVLRDVESGQLDRRQALERLAELEAARPNAPERQAEAGSEEAGSREAAGAAERDRDRAVQKAVAEAVKESLDAAPPGELKEELKKAAEKSDLGALAKVIEKLADRDMSDKELEGWIKTAEKMAKALGLKSTPKEFQELADKVRRLEEKRNAQGGLDAADQRRLQNARRALDALKREHGDVPGAQRQLQTLERATRSAADEMRRNQDERSRLAKGGKGAADQAQREQQRKELRDQIGRQMQRASDELRRQGQQQRDRQAGRVGDSRVRDLRDALRRAGERDAGRRDFEKRARDEQQQGEGGEGGRKPQGGRDQAERDAKGRRQGGQDGQEGQDPKAGQGGKGADGRDKGLGDDGLADKDGKQGKGKPDGQSGRDRPGGQGNPKPGQRFRLGEGDMPDNSRMRQMADGKPGGGGAGEGEGYGEGSGPEHGEGKVKGATAARTEKVKGAEGDGPSIKRTFVDAARRGFAKTGWRDVYGDYAEVAEEMLDKEALPPGRKALVRRYYELIRPR